MSSSADATTFMHGAGKSLGQKFDLFSPTSTLSTPNIHLIWVLLKNVPLGAWNVNFFSGIAATMGNLVRMDDETSLGSRFDVARVLINSSVPTIPNKVIKVRLDDSVVNIGVEMDPDFSLHINEDQELISGFTSSSEISTPEESTGDSMVPESILSFSSKADVDLSSDVSSYESPPLQVVREIRGSELVGDSMCKDMEIQISHYGSVFKFSYAMKKAEPAFPTSALVYHNRVKVFKVDAGASISLEHILFGRARGFVGDVIFWRSMLLSVNQTNWWQFVGPNFDTLSWLSNSLLRVPVGTYCGAVELLGFDPRVNSLGLDTFNEVSSLSALPSPCASDNLDNIPVVSSTTTVPKRGRGRPRKHSSLSLPRASANIVRSHPFSSSSASSLRPEGYDTRAKKAWALGKLLGLQFEGSDSQAEPGLVDEINLLFPQ